MNIYPSIASADCLCYQKELDRISLCPNLHIDIEDGSLSENITFGLRTAEAICNASKAENKQFHLMVRDPLLYLSDIKKIGCTEVFVHIEILDDIAEYSSICKDLDMVCGLALLAETSLECILPYVDKIKKLLFLTSKPTGRRQEDFDLEAFMKAERSRRYIPSTVELLADGGLSREHVKVLGQHGFSGVVLGRLVFSGTDAYESIKELERIQLEVI